MKKAISILWILLIGFVLPGAPCFGSSPDQFVAFGLSRLDFGQDVRVTLGDVGSNGTVDFARKIDVHGSVFANRVIAGGQTVFSGDVHFNTLQQRRQVSILGNSVTPLALPVLDSLPPIAGFSPGSTRLVERRGANVALAPGDYDKISIGRDSVVELTGGVYNARLVEIGPNARVTFLAPTTLNVSQRLTLARDSHYRGATGVAASEVLFNYAGTGTVRVGRNCTLDLNILAPRGRIALEPDSTLTGAVLAGRVTVGQNVTLTLDSAFAVRIPVPGLQGLARADAEAALVSAGLAVGGVTEAHTDTVPAGGVISQQPAAGTEVEEGTRVDVEISLGPAVILVGVPGVVGMPRADAETALQSAGLAVGVVTEANNDTVPVGGVISQQPAAGTEVEEGTGVDLVVSLGAVVDITPPSITINAPAGGGVVTRNPPPIDVSYSDDTAIDMTSLAFTANGQAIGVSCDLDQFGGQCTPDNPLVEGPITVVASIQDLAGNWATDQIHFTIAKAAPADTGATPADAPAVSVPDEHRP